MLKIDFFSHHRIVPGLKFFSETVVLIFLAEVKAEKFFVKEILWLREFVSVDFQKWLLIPYARIQFGHEIVKETCDL